jgi:NAD+ synthase
MSVSRQPLLLNCEREIERITASIREQVHKTLRRKGAVVAVSGGVDSSVAASLCVQALGKERVLALLLPEEDSSGETNRQGQLLVDHLGLDYVVEDITDALDALSCYRLRCEAIREVIPEFESHWKFKIVLQNLKESNQYRLFSVVVERPDGTLLKARLTTQAYLQLVAATNFKQRVRKMKEYYHADRLSYAVVGTPNLLEYDQGFFVKLGDGAADIKPIAHLYKTQVYQLAEYLGVPEQIRSRPPSTDTYSLPQTQEEFYFSLPYDQMDVCLYGRNHNLSVDHVGELCGLTPEQVERVYRDIDAKRRAACYLHAPPLCIPPDADGDDAL